MSQIKSSNFSRSGNPPWWNAALEKASKETKNLLNASRRNRKISKAELLKREDLYRESNKNLKNLIRRHKRTYYKHSKDEVSVPEANAPTPQQKTPLKYRESNDTPFSLPVEPHKSTFFDKLASISGNDLCMQRSKSSELLSRSLCFKKNRRSREINDRRQNSRYGGELKKIENLKAPNRFYDTSENPFAFSNPPNPDYDVSQKFPKKEGAESSSSSGSSDSSDSETSDSFDISKISSIDIAKLEAFLRLKSYHKESENKSEPQDEQPSSTTESFSFPIQETREFPKQIKNHMENLRVAVVDQNSINGSISREKWEEVRSRLNRAIMQRCVQYPECPGPVFNYLGLHWNRHWYQCEDEFSLSFLKETVDMMVDLWPNASLTVHDKQQTLDYDQNSVNDIWKVEDKPSSSSVEPKVMTHRDKMCQYRTAERSIRKYSTQANLNGIELDRYKKALNTMQDPEIVDYVLNHKQKNF